MTQSKDAAFSLEELVASANSNKNFSKEEADPLIVMYQSTVKESALLVEVLLNGKAHLAYGYKKVEAFVNNKLNLSKSRAYQLCHYSYMLRFFTTQLPIPNISESRLTEECLRVASKANAKKILGQVKKQMSFLEPWKNEEVLMSFLHKLEESKESEKKERQEKSVPNVSKYVGLKKEDKVNYILSLSVEARNALEQELNEATTILSNTMKNL